MTRSVLKGQRGGGVKHVGVHLLGVNLLIFGDVGHPFTPQTSLAGELTQCISHILVQASRLAIGKPQFSWELFPLIHLLTF